MQATQSILPVLRDAAAPLPARHPALRRQPAGVEYRELKVREILNRAPSRKLPFAWSINPYRGCEHGCSFCYARSTHEFFDLRKRSDFERKIMVKQGAAAALARRLRKSDLRGQPIAIGTATDPYQPAEEIFGITRELLEEFDRAEGLEISIGTRSPLIERDLELLTRLDRKHAISVAVSVVALDPGLARRIEPGSPPVARRLETAARLAAEGIDTTVLCAPLMPGINGGSRVLVPLLERCRELEVKDVVAQPLALGPAARAAFWPWLRREFPRLQPRYRRLYARRTRLRKRDEENLLSIFRLLRLELGFPLVLPGRA